MRFGLLGLLTVTDDDEVAVKLPGARQRALLAALLLHPNRPVPGDMLLDSVWEGEHPSAFDTTLRGAVRRLRQALGPRLAMRITARAHGYVIELNDDELDLLAFENHCRHAAEALRTHDAAAAAASGALALALWRGEPLADVDSQQLRDLCVPRLERLRAQVAEDWIEAELRLGRHELVLERLRDLTASDPLRERLHAQLMLALTRSGRRSEALAAYREARKMLVAHLGVEPGPELRALHHRILAGEEARFDHPPSGDQAPARLPTTQAPRQLPAAAGYFTGRGTELAWLTGLAPCGDLQAAAGDTVVICAVDGMAGIGKTALAVHAAHRVADRFDGGQLFLDLHGYTEGHPPREPGQALEALLRALGVPAGQIPQDTEECAALYRQRLAGTRTLIVLDNACDEAQVRPLLPGDPGCLVLVTSRRRLKGLDDARSLSLDLLPPGDAATLLRAVAGPERMAAHDPLLNEIADLCGRLPLAVRIAGALLRHRPAWSLAHLATLLRDEHRRVAALADGERDLGAVFDLSYAGQDEQHRVLFRRLGLIPGPDTDAYAAAALLECDPGAATRQLEDLVDHNLLIAHAPDRYRLHDLIRSHAAALADTDPKPDRNAALDRLLHYYAHTARSASVLIARSPRAAPKGPAPTHAPAMPDPEAARAWLRTERECLEAAYNHARVCGLDRHGLALATGLAEILRHDGPFAHAVILHQGAVESAERHGRPDALATALAELGHVRSLTGDYSTADEDLRRAAEIYRAIGDRLGEANALVEIGRVRRVTGDYRVAVNHISRAAEIYRTIGRRDGEANALIEIGRVRGLTGDFSGAGEDLRRAVEIYRAIGRRDGEASALNRLGELRTQMGDHLAALDAQSMAVRIHRELGNRLGEASGLTDMGILRMRIGDYPAALDHICEALEICRALDNRTNEANTLIFLGELRVRTGDYPEALDALTTALEICRVIGHRLGEVVALVNFGDARMRIGDCPAALDHICEALEICRALGNRVNEAWALNHYAAAVAASGDLPHALALYQQALAMNRELNKPDDEAVALEGLGECHLTAGNTQTAAANLQEALAIYQRLGMGPDAERVRTRLADPTTA